MSHNIAKLEKDFYWSKQNIAIKFKFGGQSSFFEKVVQFDEKHCWKGLMKISRLVFELEPFKDFILASEVEVDLGGQRSFSWICAELTSKLVYKIWLSYLW